MFKLIVKTAYKIAKRFNRGKALWRCIDNGNEWGVMFNPIGVGENLIGASYLMIAKTGCKIYELPVIPDNFDEIDDANQIPIASITL